MKNFIQVFLIMLFFASCKKADYVEPIVTSTEYVVADTMKLNSSYSTSDPTFYTNYNNKTYGNKEINMVSNYTIDTDGITLIFKDANGTKGNTLSIKFLGKTVDNISGTYELAGNNQIKYTNSQNFDAGTFMQIIPKVFESGTININYSLSNNFVYGFVKDAKHFIGVYTPYQSASNGITQNFNQATILLANQSVRNYNIIFNFIKKL